MDLQLLTNQIYYQNVLLKKVVNARERTTKKYKQDKSKKNLKDAKVLLIQIETELRNQIKYMNFILKKELENRK